MESLSRESQTSKEQDSDILGAIITRWQELIEERLQFESNGLNFIEEDTIGALLLGCVDLANTAFKHFIKLSLYQNALEDKIADDNPVGEFSPTL